MMVDEVNTSDKLAERPSEKSRYNIRKLFWKWHLYAGLFGAPLIMMIAVTGAILVFSPEIDELINPHLWNIESPTSSENFRSQFRPDQELVDKVQKQYNTSKILFYQQSETAETPYKFWVFTKGIKGAHEVWINPYSGEIVGERQRESAFVRIVEQLHRRLLGGEIGSLIIEFMTGWSIVLFATGLYMWWPKSWSQLKRALTVSFQGRAYQVVWRLHNVVGGWTTLILLILALSGMVFSTVSGRMYNFATLKAGGFNNAFFNPPKSEPAEGRKPVSIDQMISKIRENQLDDSALTVRFPRDEKGSLLITPTFHERATLEEMVNGQVWCFDQYTGQVIDYGTWKDAHPLFQFRQLSLTLHFGSVFGLPTKLIVLIACLAVPILGVTGYMIWWWKRKRRKPSEPPKNSSQNAPIPRWLLAVCVLTACLFPTIGVSVLAVVGYERFRLTRS